MPPQFSTIPRSTLGPFLSECPSLNSRLCELQPVCHLSACLSGEMTDGQALRADGGCEGTTSLFSLTHLGEEDDERKYCGKDKALQEGGGRNRTGHEGRVSNMSSEWISAGSEGF